MKIRLCDNKKIKLNDGFSLAERKNFILELIEGNEVYKDYYYDKEDGKVILDFLATYFLNGEQSSQKKIKNNAEPKNEAIKTYFKNNSLIIMPSKETRTLKKIKVADKKIKRNNARLSYLVKSSENNYDFSSLVFTISQIKIENDELKKDLYYLIDDYVCETELLVNYGK